MLWILCLKFYSHFWFSPLSTELAVMFMFKISSAMKSLDKKTNSHPHYKAAPGRLSHEKCFLKDMDRIQMTMNVVCKTRTSARSNIHKSPPILMAKTVTVTVWVPEIFIKSNKTILASDCMLPELYHYRVEGWVFLLPDGGCSSCASLDMCWHLVVL